MTLPETLYLGLAVNDDGGNHTGEVSHVEFSDPSGGEILILDGAPIRCYLLKDKSKLKLARRIFPIEAYGTWHGSMVYDAAVVTIDTAEQMAQYLRERGWEYELALEGIGTQWTDGQPLDFRSAIEDSEALEDADGIV
jgi:hypothetical protein